MLQKLNENFGFESQAALGRVLHECEILPDDRVSCVAFVSATGLETRAAAPVLELDPGGGFSMWVLDSVYLGSWLLTWLVGS